MTDVKISALTATEIFGDTDLIPIVQSGDTKKITGLNLKAGLAPAAATELTAGIAKIATTAEAISRTEDSRIMTSKKVQDWADNGIVLNGADGGGLGAGSINAQSIFINGESISASGGLVPIETQEIITGVSTVEFTDQISDVYSNLILYYNNLTFAGSPSSIFFDFTLNGGASFGSFSTIVSGITLTGLSGITKIYNFSEVGHKISEHRAIRNTTGAVVETVNVFNDSNILNGFRLRTNTGTITGGFVSLYGVAK